MFQELFLWLCKMLLLLYENHGIMFNCLVLEKNKLNMLRMLAVRSLIDRFVIILLLSVTE